MYLFTSHLDSKQNTIGIIKILVSLRLFFILDISFWVFNVLVRRLIMILKGILIVIAFVVASCFLGFVYKSEEKIPMAILWATLIFSLTYAYF